MVLSNGQLPLYASAGSGMHQQNLGGVIVGGEEVLPLAFADFENAVYEVDGEAAAITDIFVENADFGAYDPSDVVTGVGLVNSRPTFTPALVPATYSVIFNGVFDAATSQVGSSFYSIEAPDYNQEMQFGLNWTPSDLEWIPRLNAPGGATSSITHFPPETTLYRLAVSVNGLNVHAAINGSSVLSVTDATPSILNTVGLIAASETEDEPLLSVGLYPYLDPAELTALSEIS